MCQHCISRKVHNMQLPKAPYPDISEAAMQPSCHEQCALLVNVRYSLPVFSNLCSSGQAEKKQDVCGWVTKHPSEWQTRYGQYRSALEACFCLHHCSNSKLQCQHDSSGHFSSKAEWDLLKKYSPQCCKPTIDRSFQRSPIYGGYREKHPFVYDLFAQNKYCSWATADQLQVMCVNQNHTAKPVNFR